MALCPGCRTVIPCHCHLTPETPMPEPLTTQEIAEITAVTDAAAQLGADIDPATVTALLADNQHLRQQLARAEAAIEHVRRLCADPVHRFTIARADVLAALDGAEPDDEPAAARPAATTQDSQP